MVSFVTATILLVMVKIIRYRMSLENYDPIFQIAILLVRRTFEICI